MPHALLLAAALAAPVAAISPAPPTALDYQRKAIAIYADGGNFLQVPLQKAIFANGRFVGIPTVPARGQSVASFVAEIGKSRQGAAPTYVLVPSLRLGSTTSTAPTISKSERKGGGFDGRASAYLTCPYTLTLEVYDAFTGKQVGSATDTTELSRSFEYRYDERTSVDALQYKAHELARVMAQEAGRPPALAFASQAESARDRLVSGALYSLKRMALFRLEVQLSGWSQTTDRIAFNLGKSMGVRLDESFALVRDGRQIGSLKVRSVTDTLSEAQPLYLDEVMQPTDHVVEASQAMWNHGLRVGGGYIAGPLATFGIAGEVNVGPTFGASERYLTYDLGGVTNGAGTGVMGNFGYAHKFFARRWALRLGGKVGFIQLNGLTGGTPLPGVALATGADYHFSEWLLWGFDLDLAAYYPFVQSTGPFAGQTIYPVGPLARTGVTILF